VKSCIVGKPMLDNPLKCDRRKKDKCSSQDCEDEEFKGICCLFCPKKKTCWKCCFKVQSYLYIEKGNPSSRLSKGEETEKQTIEDLETLVREKKYG